MSETLTPQAALIYVMVMMSAADSSMADRELYTIGEIVRTLPVFRGFDIDQLVPTAQACAERLADNEGLEATLDAVREALPARLRETAYALACDIAAADSAVGDEEMRLLELIRHSLGLERLVAAAIERGARARHSTV